MNCREFEERLDAYLAGDGDDRPEYDRHVESCNACLKASEVGRAALAALAGLRRPALSMKRRLRMAPVAVGILALALIAWWAAPGSPAAPAPELVRPAPRPPEPNRLRGKVVVAGRVPQRKKIRVGVDPACMDSYKEAPMLSEDLVVKDVGGEHRVANAVVYVASPISGAFPDATEPKRLRQVGCRYDPHVLGLRVGQPLEIRNEDPTLHNVHASPELNREFNLSQAKSGLVSTHRFEIAERAIRLKCDVHPWMTAWVFVFDHPFYAITGEDGTFEIPDLPSGAHEIAIWHEKLGEKRISIATANGPVERTIVFEVDK